MIGVLKSFLGLSGSFFTTIYVSFLEPDAVSFLLLLAIVPSAIVLVCTFVINFVPYIQVEPHTKVCHRCKAHLHIPAPEACFCTPFASVPCSCDRLSLTVHAHHTLCAFTRPGGRMA